MTTWRTYKRTEGISTSPRIIGRNEGSLKQQNVNTQRGLTMELLRPTSHGWAFASKGLCMTFIHEIKKIVIKIIFWWCLNWYYSMILSRCYYKSSKIFNLVCVFEHQVLHYRSDIVWVPEFRHFCKFGRENSNYNIAFSTSQVNYLACFYMGKLETR